jgi:acetyl esterase/lipase
MQLKQLLLFVSVATLLFSCQPEDVPPQSTGPLRDTTIKNLSYGADASQKIDLGLPADRTANTPLVVVVHGGGWSTGDKSELSWMINGFKQRGFAVANINYRLILNTADNYKMQLDDINGAVEFVLGKATEYSFNGQKLYIVGHSAGAHLSLCYAYTRNANGKVKAVGSMAGPTNLFSMSYYNSVVYDPILKPFLGVSLFPITSASEQRYKTCSPLFQASSAVAPTIFFHGDLDPVVNPDQATSMANTLGTLGVDKKLVTYPLTFHDWWADGTKTNNTLDELKNWFNGHP